MRSPCDCLIHRYGASTEVDGHTYDVGSRTDEGGWNSWRYLCSCGSRGRWTYQSDSVAYHAWLAHIRRAQRQQNLRQIEADQ